jgi:hypothetical protein
MKKVQKKYKLMSPSVLYYKVIDRLVFFYSQAVPDQTGDAGERERGGQRVVAAPLHEHLQEAPLSLRRGWLGAGRLRKIVI